MRFKQTIQSFGILGLLIIGYTNCGKFGHLRSIDSSNNISNAVGASYLSTDELLNDDQVVYSAPIVIIKGGEYSGSWKSEVATQPAVIVKTSEPVKLINCRTKSRGIHISAPWSKANLTVENCVGIGLNSNVAGRATGRFIAAEGFESINIHHNLFKSTGGIYLNSWKPGQGSGIIKIYENYGIDIDGRQSDGKGGFNGEKSWAQFAQLNSVQSNPNVEISWNRTFNTPRQSFIEDTVNLYSSSGTSQRSIMISHNLFQGAYAIDPSTAYSGGGIMLGDGCESEFSTADANTIIETSNYGIAIANGNHQKITNNIVLGRGKLSDGTLLDQDTDAGIYARNYCNRTDIDKKSNFVTENIVSWGSPTASNPNSRWDTSTPNAVDPENLKVTRLEPLNQLVLESVIQFYVDQHLAVAKSMGKHFGPLISVPKN